ncbi:hypothetical protein SAMN06297251_111151 [Fulvimarina manganoxydans]|uniref:IraD/Gp25-like domain-containing protein n=1 Tax=Fulvimarina manganoxydans TaxID=937218 RepID=A0A1W2CVG6_9HYPH|nr:hypothetical protein [Fulvimarina manganoxydans]SMC89210.1 hypothetical protein SAMN06297251_111151 [Fulvimarina manganoxydans]
MPTPIARFDIPYAHWSLKVGRDAPAPGEIVAQIADLEQGIHNLVLTPTGSVPTEPEKGCDVMDYIDRPPAVAIPALTETIWEGLNRWHPRIVVGSVQVTHDPSDREFSRYACPIFWGPRESILAEFIRTVVPLSRSEIARRLGAGTVF